MEQTDLIKSKTITYMPTTILEALKYYDKMHNALLYAGGTYILNNNSKREPSLPSEIIYLARIKELTGMRRTDSYLEIGSMTTLSELLSPKQFGRFVPIILKTAIYEIGTKAVRNIATIGGNISVNKRKLTLLPILVLLNAKIEVRSVSKKRWIDLKKFQFAENGLELNIGEIVTRIRIPSFQYNIQSYKSLNNNAINAKDYFSFACIGKNSGEILDRIGFVFNIDSETILRSKKSEDNLVGKKIPLNDKEIKNIVEIFKDDINQEIDNLISFKKNRIIDTFELFLNELQ